MSFLSLSWKKFWDTTLYRFFRRIQLFEKKIDTLVYVSIDESGILTSGQGDYFVLAAYVTQDRSVANRCIKNTRQKLGKKSKKTEEIKFNNSRDETITYLLENMNQAVFKVYYIAYRKHPGNTNTKKTQKELIKNLLQFIQLKEETDEINIDNFLNSKQERNTYIDELKELLKIEKITIVNSNTCPGVQIADFIAGALHKHLCSPDDMNGQKYYNLIKEKCVKV